MYGQIRLKGENGKRYPMQIKTKRKAYSYIIPDKIDFKTKTVIKDQKKTKSIT